MTVFCIDPDRFLTEKAKRKSPIILRNTPATMPQPKFPQCHYFKTQYLKHYCPEGFVNRCAIANF